MWTEDSGVDRRFRKSHPDELEGDSFEPYLVAAAFSWLVQLNEFMTVMQGSDPRQALSRRQPWLRVLRKFYGSAALPKRLAVNPDEYL